MQKTYKVTGFRRIKLTKVAVFSDDCVVWYHRTPDTIQEEWNKKTGQRPDPRSFIPSRRPKHYRLNTAPRGLILPAKAVIPTMDGTAVPNYVYVSKRHPKGHPKKYMTFIRLVKSIHVYVRVTKDVVAISTEEAVKSFIRSSEFGGNVKVVREYSPREATDLLHSYIPEEGDHEIVVTPFEYPKPA